MVSDSTTASAGLASKEGCESRNSGVVGGDDDHDASDLGGATAWVCACVCVCAWPPSISSGGTIFRTGSRTHSRLSRAQVPQTGNVFWLHFLRLFTASLVKDRGILAACIPTYRYRQVKHPVLSCCEPFRLLTLVVVEDMDSNISGHVLQTCA